MAITLKAARVNAGYGTKEAADFIGVSVDTLTNWEKAKTFPDVPKIKKIEDLYGVKYADIIFLPNVSELVGNK